MAIIKRAALVIGVTAMCGLIPSAAGMYWKGATLQESLWAGGLIWFLGTGLGLGIVVLFLCIRWLGRMTRPPRDC